MRLGFCLLLGLLLGCQTRSREERITTPAKTVECPVCGETATLWRFNRSDADYNCPNHHIEFNRQYGYFDHAMPVDKVTTHNE